MCDDNVDDDGYYYYYYHDDDDVDDGTTLMQGCDTYSCNSSIVRQGQDR